MILGQNQKYIANISRYSLIIGMIGISPYSVRMWENAGKMRTRLTPNTDTFYAVEVSFNNPGINWKQNYS